MTDDAARLAGTWRIIEVVDATIPEGAVPQLVFEPDRLAGFAGCNNFGASLRYDGDGQITLGEAVATLNICGAAVMALEAQVLNGLSIVNSVAFDGDDMVALLAYGDVMMRAERLR